MKSLKAIRNLRNGDNSVLKNNKWLEYLYYTEEDRNINVEKFENMASIQKNSVLDYVEKTLILLDSYDLDRDFDKCILEEVLCWSEVAKCGTKLQRKTWSEHGYNLEMHNIGSSEIFEADNSFAKKYNPSRFETAKILIATHGYIGQYIRGEVNIDVNMPVLSIDNGYYGEKRLYDMLCILNKCIIGAVSTSLLESLENTMSDVIYDIVYNGKTKSRTFKERLQLLRSAAINNGESFSKEITAISNSRPDLIDNFNKLSSKHGLWYFEPATSELTLKETLLLISSISNISEDYEGLSFISVMNQLYYDYKGKKKINIYKKRILEKVLNSDSLSNEHLKITTSVTNKVAFINLEFSTIADKLIDFCVAAEGNGAIYEKAIIMLYDLFEFRRDEYDRFNNEDEYLEQMNESLIYKASLLDYVVGETVLDVGPGGGALLDLMEERFPNKNILGIDISSNVIESLNKKKSIENKNWSVIQGDALNLKGSFESGEIDTIVLSSIVHELFSYIPYEGKKFNYDTLKTAFRSLFEVIPSGGRIVIRDGVMSNNKEDIRVIKFKNNDDINILDRYCKDFKGREITYIRLNEDSVSMKINDAMEFLYTYTWGEESYSHEINEQFGYFTPSEYIKFMTESLGDTFFIVECKSYLQEGYPEYLLDKIDIFDDSNNVVELPDSTIVLVLEKK